MSDNDERIDCPYCGKAAVTFLRENQSFMYGAGIWGVELHAHVDVGRCAACGFEFTDIRAEAARADAVCRHLQGVVVALKMEGDLTRDLLRQMRDEGEEAWRWVEDGRGKRRNGALFAKVEDKIGPSSWDQLIPMTHIVWGEDAICRWTAHPVKRWPKSQKHVMITQLIIKKDVVVGEDSTEFVAYPAPDWNGVSCDDCKTRLPTLLRELGIVMREMREGIMTGFREKFDEEDRKKP